MFEIKHLDSRHEVIAEGLGIAKGGSKFVKGGMVTSDPALQGYWAIIRSYEENSNFQAPMSLKPQPLECGKQKSVVVVSICSVDHEDCQFDGPHYILDKVDF